VNYEFLNVNYLIVNFEFLIQFVGGIELLKLVGRLSPQKRGAIGLFASIFLAHQKRLPLLSLTQVSPLIINYIFPNYKLIKLKKS
jgi:hypothetical protein